jgi:hypothetical protein
MRLADQSVLAAQPAVGKSRSQKSQHFPCLSVRTIQRHLNWRIITILDTIIYNWESDLDGAREQARAGRKEVLVYFTKHG